MTRENVTPSGSRPAGAPEDTAATGINPGSTAFGADETLGINPGARGPDDEPALGAQDLSTELPQRLADAEAKAAEHYEAFLRARADLENVRRRAQDDVAKAHKYALENFAEALVPVMDSLEMALKVEVPSVESLREGVEATLRQLSSAFDKHRLLVIDPVGQKFDPHRHQAISTVPASAVNPPLPPNHVASVLQKGYLIHDRVLRPALVTVVQG